MSENAKRILLVVTQSEMGGVQQYMIGLANEARRRGKTVLLVAGGEGELPDVAATYGIPFQKLKNLKRSISPIHDLFAVQELRRLIREWKPDIVDLNSSKAGIVGAIAAHREDVPRIVYRIGGWSFLDPVSPLQKKLRLWSEQITAPLKDVIITVHPGDEDLAKKLKIQPREKIVTIPNGLDLSACDEKLLPRDEARTKLREIWKRDGSAGLLPESDFKLVITIANFYPTKNLLGFLDAIKRLDVPNARFLIIGDGAERSLLEQKRRELGIEKIVSLPGMVSGASIYLHGADLFVLPSKKEGMPWTILEAMAAGLPIVATDVGACKWMLGGAGNIVAPHDAAELATAITHVLSDQNEASKMGASARKHLEQTFSAKAMWNTTFKTFDS